MQYLYKDGESFHFMDTSSYEQLHIADGSRSATRSTTSCPTRSSRWSSTASEPVGIELPPTVDLKVEDTAPGIKGATASNQVKPARLETGLVVNVPPFVNTGDMIRVSTDTGEYLSRV